MSNLDGNELLVACGRRDTAARAAQDLLAKALDTIATRLNVYFKQRLKGSHEILRKVQRKRSENSPSEVFNPDDVEDAWGCRFVVLVQPEIAEVLDELLDLAQSGQWRQNGLCIRNIVYYSNRPENDPLALHKVVERLINDAASASERFTRPTLRPAINPESGYSSLHIILEVSVEVDHGMGKEAIPTSFEIQVRDVFEDAWGEISHRLAYKRRESARVPEVDQNDRRLITARSRELNALKASADACSQHAMLIERSLTYFLDSAGLTGTELSVSTLDDDAREILKLIPSSNGILREIVADAYRLMQDAHQAQVKEIDNELPCKFYSAAALKFANALARLDSIVSADGQTHVLDVKVIATSGMPIRYYLTLECANAMVRSVPKSAKLSSGKHRDTFDRAISLYKDLRDRSQFYSDDATIHLRLGQALVRIADTPELIQEAIEVLTRADDCAKKDRTVIALGASHWLPLEIMHQIVFAQFKAADQSRKSERFIDLLERAAIEASTVADEAQKFAKANSGNVNLAHKCINNALYFAEELVRERARRKLGGDERDREEKSKIRSYISLLRRRPYRTFVETHTETIDTLMRAAELVGDRLLAIDMAEKNVLKLRQIARARGVTSDPATIPKNLDKEERRMYRDALKLATPFGEDEPGEEPD